MDYTKLLTGRSGDGARSTTKELSDRCSTQIKAHRRYPLDLPSKNEVQIKEALRRICDGDTYRAVASSHFQSMVQTYALEAYKINKTGDLQIRWTQVKEYLLQHPWESPSDTYPKTSTWWNVKKGEKGVKTTRKQTKSQAICRMMQDLTFLKVFSSIDLFMDKPTNVRVKRAIKAFYKAKGVKHEDWLEKANRLTMKEFKAICLSKSLPEHGAYPLMDLYSIARFKHEDIRVWFDRIQKIQTTLTNFVGFNQIRDINFLIPFEFALSTKERSFLKTKAQDCKYPMFDNGGEEGTPFQSSQHHLYEMNLEHIGTMLEDSTMELPKWTQTQQGVKRNPNHLYSQHFVNGMEQTIRNRDLEIRDLKRANHKLKIDLAKMPNPHYRPNTGSNATPTGARPPKRQQDPWVRPTHLSPKPKAPVRHAHATPNKQATWPIDVRNIPNSLPEQAQYRLKQRHQIMTLLKDAMPSGKPIKESDWYVKGPEARITNGLLNHEFCPHCRKAGRPDKEASHSRRHKNCLLSPEHKSELYKLSGKPLEDALAEHTRKMREKRIAKSKKAKSRKPKGTSKVARARPHPQKRARGTTHVNGKPVFRDPTSNKYFTVELVDNTEVHTYAYFGYEPTAFTKAYIAPTKRTKGNPGQSRPHTLTRDPTNVEVDEGASHVTSAMDKPSDDGASHITTDDTDTAHPQAQAKEASEQSEGLDNDIAAFLAAPSDPMSRINKLQADSAEAPTQSTNSDE